MERTGKLVVGITGASGALYAVRFLQQAPRYFREVYLICSEQAIQVLQTELELTVTRETLSAETLLGKPWEGLKVLEPRDYFSPPASGSFRHDGMVIVPCSMGTLGRIANGSSDDLLTVQRMCASRSDARSFWWCARCRSIGSICAICSWRLKRARPSSLLAPPSIIVLAPSKRRSIR
jgi:hypothetical protein